MFNVTIKSWWHSGGSWFLEIRAGIQNKVGTQWEISRKRRTEFKLQNIKSTSSRVPSLLFLVSQATLPHRAEYDVHLQRSG